MEQDRSSPTTPKHKIRKSGAGARDTRREAFERREMTKHDPKIIDRMNWEREETAMMGEDTREEKLLILLNW
jgi:hypothetical protein